jgi:hypothetical protein
LENMKGRAQTQFTWRMSRGGRKHSSLGECEGEGATAEGWQSVSGGNAGVNENDLTFGIWDMDPNGILLNYLLFRGKRLALHGGLWATVGDAAVDFATDRKVLAGSGSIVWYSMFPDGNPVPVSFFLFSLFRTLVELGAGEAARGKPSEVSLSCDQPFLTGRLPT